MSGKQRRSPRRKAEKDAVTPEELARSESQARLHAHCEKAWKRLADPPEEEDRWSAVEEHLLLQSSREDPERRWKYFSK